MEFIANYGLFLAKAVTIVICLVVLISIIVANAHRSGKSHRGHIEVTNLNDRYTDMADTIKHSVLDPVESKFQLKLQKKQDKQKNAAKKKALKAKRTEAEAPKKRIFVLNFHGDIRAAATTHMREEITAVLSLASTSDEIVVRLESSGGMVHSYGLAASQLSRIRHKNIPLTVCVDKVAASGGYMMACVADKILAAPFAILGSIGVVGQLPNFHRLLQKHSIDYEMQTAGEFKRTLTVFGENTDKARQKFAEELEETHSLFKEFIRDNRQELDVDAVATGETWYGLRALERKLIDGIQTSDEYLTDQVESADIFEVEYVVKKSLPEKFGMASQESVDRLLLTWWERIYNSRFFS